MRTLRCAVAAGWMFAVLACAAVVVSNASPSPSPALAAPAESDVAAPLAVTPSWRSSIQVHNVDTVTGTVQVVYYSRSGGDAIQATNPGPVELAPGRSVIYYPYNDSALPNGWTGSAEVLSDVRVRVSSSTTSSNVRAKGMYNGIPKDDWDDGTASTLSVPLVKNNWASMSSSIYVQNASDSPMTVTITYRGGSQTPGGPYIFTDSSLLQPGFAREYRPSQANGLPGTFLGSAVVTNSTGGAMAVVYDDKYSDATSVLLSGGGFKSDASGTTLYAPLVKKAYQNYRTSINIQNVGRAPTRVRVTYRSAVTGQAYTSAVCGGSEYVQPSALLVCRQYTEPDSALPSSFYGAATITSLDGEPIVAIVNETVYSGPLMMTANEAFPAGRGSDRVVFPVYKNWYQGSVSGVMIQNIGSAPTRLQGVYVDARTGVQYVATQNTGYLQPGASAKFKDEPILPGTLCRFSCGDSGFLGALTVRSLDGQPIVGMINEQDRAGDTDLMSAPGLNVPD